MNRSAPIQHVRRRPAEAFTGAAGLVTALVAAGVDRPVAAWIAVGVGVLPSLVSPVVDWWRARPADRAE